MSPARVAAFTFWVFSFLFIAACGEMPPGAPSGPQATAVTIAGVHTLTSKGETLQLRAIVTFADGSTGDETGTAKWVSTDPGVAAITTAGMVTALRDGRSTMTATVRGVSDARTVIVDLAQP